MNNQVTITPPDSHGRILVRAPFALGAELREVPTARWQATRRGWAFAATRAVALRLAAITGPHPVLDEIAGADPLPAREDDNWLDDGGTPRWRHQVRGAWWLADRDAALLQYGMGTGKTRIALDALRLVEARRTLVVCPLAVVPVWAAQAERWAPDTDVLPLDSRSVPARAKALSTFLAVPRPRALVAINYDSVWRSQISDEITGQQWDAVIYDECHRIKSPSSSVSTFAARLRARAARRWGLSGTPLAHSPLDAYAIFRALDPGIFGTNFSRFRSTYAEMGGWKNKQVVGYRNLADFRERYYTLTLAQDRDVLDLPATHHVEIPVKLTSETREIYQQLKDDFVAELEGGTVTAAHALTRLLRLQQLTGGALDYEGGEPAHRSTEKGDALVDFFLDLDPAEPVVVFARFRHDLEAAGDAARRAGRHVCELSGRMRQLAEWQADTRGSVLVTQIQSGGEGIDLTRAAHCVYYSLGFSLAQYEQSLARTHRPGQSRPVTYYHLIASGTIDRYVYRTLRQRRDVIDAVLADGLKGE